MKLAKKRSVPSVVEMKIDEYNKRFGTKAEEADGIQSSGKPSSPLSITIDGKPLFELYPDATLDDVQAFLGSLQKGQSADYDESLGKSFKSLSDSLSGGSEYEATLGRPFRELQHKLKSGVADKKLGKGATAKMKSNVGSLRKLLKRTSASDEKSGDGTPLASAVTIEDEQGGAPDDTPTKPMASGETKAKGEGKVKEDDPASAVGWLPEEDDDDVYMDPNIEAVRQGDDIIIGFYDRTPQEEEHGESGFDLGIAAYNLSLAIDGAIVKTLALGASGMELLHSFLVKAKCGEKDRALEAPKEDPAKATVERKSDVDLALDAPAAASDLLHEDEDPSFVGDAAEEPEQSLIHPMILEKLNEFTEQIKSATVQSYSKMTSFADAPPHSDVKNAEPIDKGTGGNGNAARQMDSYSCDALTEANPVENLRGFVQQIHSKAIPSCSDMQIPESIDIHCIGSDAGLKKMALPDIPPVCPAPLDDSRNDCVESNDTAVVSGIAERQEAFDEELDRAEGELEWVASEDIEEAERLIAACAH